MMEKKKPPRTAFVHLNRETGIWHGAAANMIGDAEKPPAEYYSLPIRVMPVDLGGDVMARAVRVDSSGVYGWVPA